MKKTIPIIIALLLTTFLYAGPAPRMVARIDNPSPSDLEHFTSSGADIAAFKPGVYLDIVVDADELDLLRADFPQIYITQTENQLKEHLRPERDIPGYRNYSQMVNELTNLQAQYPALMQTSPLGTGWGSVYADQNLPAYIDFDHDILAVKVSANVQETEDEPAFYFVGEHHAREPLSTEVCMGILIHLLENYGTDPVVTGILDDSEIWIVPLLNPDGHKIVIEETDVWWRKNIRDNNNNQSFDHNYYGSGYDGVDLNRNYAYYWGYTSSTDDMFEATYHGPEPFSEPETQILRDLILSRRFLAGIGYHTYGELVLYPYGYVNGIVAPDGTELQALANEMADLLPSMSGVGNYTPGPSWGLYPVSGSLDDWSYSQTGAFPYTIEMADEFIPPYAAVPTIVQHQVNAALAMMQRKDKKILRGHVTDSQTGDPLEARIYIEGFDNHALYRAPVRSDSLFGAYYYLLPAGEYSVSYICPGYETEVRIVVINPIAPTIEDVCLTPSQPYELSIQIQGDYFEPLSGATLIIEDIPDTVYTSGPQGNVTIWDFYPGTYQLVVSKPGYETLSIMRHISSGTITLRITSQPMILEDFEMSLSNWTTSGSWGRSEIESYSGSYSLADSPTSNYQNNSNSTCRLTDPLNLQNIDNVNLKFMLKTSLALDGDNLILECSSDASSWAVIDCYEGTSDWTEKSYNLNSYADQDLHIRFRLYTSNWGSSDGVYIDDFKLFANADVSTASDNHLPPVQVTASANPNPFSNYSKIHVKTASTHANASITIFNTRGQVVKTLLDTKKLTKGTHEFTWNGWDNKGSETANGVYFLRIADTSGTLASIKIARIK